MNGFQKFMSADRTPEEINELFTKANLALAADPEWPAIAEEAKKAQDAYLEIRSEYEKIESAHFRAQDRMLSKMDEIAKKILNS